MASSLTAMASMGKQHRWEVSLKATAPLGAGAGGLGNQPPQGGDQDVSRVADYRPSGSASSKAGAAPEHDGRSQHDGATIAAMRTLPTHKGNPAWNNRPAELRYFVGGLQRLFSRR